LLPSSSCGAEFAHSTADGQVNMAGIIFGPLNAGVGTGVQGAKCKDICSLKMMMWFLKLKSGDRFFSVLDSC
jgi:hypothetical protein